MTVWVKCTAKTGNLILVNLSTAMSAIWNDHEGCTIIAYPGGDENVVRVKERPEKILAAADIDFSSATLRKSE